MDGTVRPRVFAVFVTRNLPDLRREHVFDGFEIEARLHVHPERGADFEELAEPQRSVGGHGFFLPRDALDPGARHVQRGCDGVGYQLERNEKSACKEARPARGLDFSPNQ